MADPKTPAEPQEAPQQRANPILASILAWLIPGAGHVFLRRPFRGLIFLGIVLTMVTIGVYLEGDLPISDPAHPLSRLRALTAAALGLPYLVLRFAMGYQGEVMAPGFEYGSAFILTAGLMNLLLMLDSWDIASGRKD